MCDTVMSSSPSSPDNSIFTKLHRRLLRKRGRGEGERRPSLRTYTAFPSRPLRLALCAFEMQMCCGQGRLGLPSRLGPRRGVVVRRLTTQ